MSLLLLAVSSWIAVSFGTAGKCDLVIAPSTFMPAGIPVDQVSRPDHLFAGHGQGQNHLLSSAIEVAEEECCSIRKELATSDHPTAEFVDRTPNRRSIDRMARPEDGPRPAEHAERHPLHVRYRVFRI